MMKKDDQARTSPHGDALMAGAATRRAMARPEIPHNVAGVPIMADAGTVDRRIRELALEISRRSPVDAAPIYRALLHHSAEDVEAAIEAASTAGVDPSSFPVYLVAAQISDLTTEEIDALVRVADPPWRTPSADMLREGMERMPDVVPSGRVPQPLRLPSHIERAARRAWRNGRESAEHSRHHPPGTPMHIKFDDDYGVDAFLCSIQADADAARRST